MNCTCPIDESHYAAAWHDEDCPRHQGQCERCSGEGRVSFQLGCGCCSDTEECEDCKGTGNAPYTDELAAAVARAQEKP
jgi:DnaJ-class molecular chaperone